MAPRPHPYRAVDGTVTWQVRFRVEGSPNPVKETFESQAGAERFARLVDAVGGTAARATRGRGEDSAREMPTLRTWLDRHLQSVSAYASRGTPDGYRRKAERTWLPRLGHLPLDAITREAVVDWVAWQREQETARSRAARARAEREHAKDPSVRIPDPVRVRPKTIRNAHALLSATLQDAVDADPQLITRNPAKGVRIPSDSADTETEILTQAEWQALQQAIPAHWPPSTTFLIVTGVRIGEASAVQVRDLDSPTPTAQIRRAWKKDARDGRYLGSPKSRRGTRAIRIGGDLADILRPPTVARAADDLIFTSPQGARVQAQHYNNRVWKPALADTGITKHTPPTAYATPRRPGCSWPASPHRSCSTTSGTSPCPRPLACTPTCSPTRRPTPPRCSTHPRGRGRSRARRL